VPSAPDNTPHDCNRKGLLSFEQTARTLSPSVGLSAPGQKWRRILPQGPEFGNSRRLRTIIDCDSGPATGS